MKSDKYKVGRQNNILHYLGISESRVKKLNEYWLPIHKFVANVFDTTSIHGLTYITKEGSHAIER